MKELKKEKIEEVLHRLAATFVREESTNASLITVTRVQVSKSGKEATVFFTTLPTEQEETAEKFLTRKVSDFRHYIRDHSRLGMIPQMDFQIDFGERNRQRLDDLGKEN